MSSTSSNGRIKIGHYNILSTIGTGSFGKVKRNSKALRFIKTIAN